MNYWLFILPIISAFAGWFVTWLSFRKLLRSSAMHRKLISGLTTIINDQLPGSNFLEQKISDPALLKTAGPMIEKHVDDFLRIKLSKEMPFISHFIGDKTINSLKALFMQELEVLFPEVMKGFLDNIKTEIDPQKFISRTFETIPPPKFQQAVSKILSADINKIAITATAVGFFFGLVELIILYLAL